MDLKPLFEPRSMAVFGVSLSNDRHPANEIFNKNLLRYPVRVFGVNPRGGTINGEVIHRSITEVPEPVDLAVIAVKADIVPGVLSECIEAKARSAVVISGGFGEVGRRDLQERLADIAKEASFPFIGPNCLGIYAPSRVDTFFLPGERMVTPAPGNVSFVSQSGGILVDQMINFTNEGVGLAKAISIGNKALLGELEILDYLAADPVTKVIAFYIEGFGANEGREFVLSAGRCGKPVVVLKSGKSPAGSAAVSAIRRRWRELCQLFRGAVPIRDRGGNKRAGACLFLRIAERIRHTLPWGGRNRYGQRGARRDCRRCLRGTRDSRPRAARGAPGDAPQNPERQCSGDRHARRIPSTSPGAVSTRILSRRSNFYLPAKRSTVYSHCFSPMFRGSRPISAQSSATSPGSAASRSSPTCPMWRNTPCSSKGSISTAPLFPHPSRGPCSWWKP